MISNIEVWRYGNALSHPVGGKVQTWQHREGLLLRLITDRGEIGQGEASPLPGSSLETIDEVQFFLSAISTSWASDLLALGEVGSLLRAIAGSAVATLPSARFAVETALLDLLGQRTQKALWQLFDVTPPSRVALSQVLPADDNQRALTVAEQAWARGVYTFKVKIGSLGRWDEDLALLETLRSRFGAQLQLRLDANQEIEREHLETKLRQLVAFSPEYLEEPCPFPSLAGCGELPVTLALDDTLALPGIYNQVISFMEQHPGTSLVLKPMKLGGFAACLDWAHLAHQHRGSVSMSHLFDGPVALAACAQLAICLPGDQRAAGLTPHIGLQAWPPSALPLIGASAIMPSQSTGLGMGQLVPPTS
ncbi:MAG TPA: enolase C-terminal domain-like protein [Polyangiaceae bacterium]|nr:enolase C-terminal domain-like protein [Polyangiaceae bacterium]